MSQFEDDAKTHYEKLGYEVLDSGWPDFLLIDKTTSKIKCAEIKALGDTLKPNQKRLLSVLSANGMDVVVYKQTTSGNKEISMSHSKTETTTKDEKFISLCASVQTSITKAIAEAEFVSSYQKLKQSAATKEGLAKAIAKGQQLGRPKKLNEVPLSILTCLYNEGKTLKEIAAMYNVSIATISRKLMLPKTEHLEETSV